MRRTEVLVVIPAWNEEATVGEVVKAVSEAGWSVLVVNDGSTDNTRVCAREAGAAVLDMPFNVGVGAALRCGFKYAVRAGYLGVVQCDADGQHPVSHIDALYQAQVLTGADMVIGSRFAQESHSTMEVRRLRRLAMSILARSASRAVGRPISDASSGFRLISGDLLQELARHLPNYYLGDTFEAVVAAGRAHYRVEEIPAPLTSRLHGSSSAGSWRAAGLTVKVFATSALHIHRRLAVAGGTRDIAVQGTEPG